MHSPSWQLVGLVLILIGFFVRFEVQVVESDGDQEIKSQKGVKGRNEING